MKVKFTFRTVINCPFSGIKIGIRDKARDSEHSYIYIPTKLSLSKKDDCFSSLSLSVWFNVNSCLLRTANYQNAIIKLIVSSSTDAKCRLLNNFSTPNNFRICVYRSLKILTGESYFFSMYSSIEKVEIIVCR